MRALPRSAGRSALALAVALLAATLVLRAYSSTPPRFLYPDAFYYAEMGRQIARGEGFTSLQAYPFLLSWLERSGLDVAPPWPNVSRFPLVMLLYAGPFLAFGASEATVFGVGIAFFVATCVLTFLLGARLFGDAAGALAAVLVATNLSQIVFALTGLLETPAGFFAIAAGLALVATLDADPGARGSRLRATGLGVVLGLAFLLRYDLLALAPAAALVLCLRHGRRSAVALACLAFGFALVVGPWVARNLASFGSPVAFLGLDRNVLWSRATGDPYAGEYAAFWEQLASKPELVDAKLANVTWPVRNWYVLFGWGLAGLGPAFVVAGPVLRTLRHPALLPYVFVAVAFLLRWAIFTLTHHEPRFYASFVPLFLVFATGAGWLLLERLTVLRPAARAAGFAVAAALLLFLTLPRPSADGGEPAAERPPREPDAEQYALLRARTAPDAVIATSFAEGVAWYGERPSLGVPPARIRDLERRGLRIEGLLYGAGVRRHVEHALRRQRLAREFFLARVDAASALWLRRRPASALKPDTSRSPSPSR